LSRAREFDPDGTHMRRWVPEPAGVPAARPPERRTAMERYAGAGER
jgi:deoxyribodipyrimidine photolyase